MEDCERQPTTRCNALSKDGLARVMRVCLAAFVEKNSKAAKANLSDSMAPGLKFNFSGIFVTRFLFRF
jgi:hypothetical protein